MSSYGKPDPDVDWRRDWEAEKQASSGLNIIGFHGKWGKAKELARLNERTGGISTDDNKRLLPYWERVRLIFLGLGGEYVEDESCRQG